MHHFIRSIMAVSLLALASPGHAEAGGDPQPGFFRLPLGRFVVTALYDGSIDIDAKALTRVGAADRQSQPTTGPDGQVVVPAAVNAYLVDTGRRRVLVDAGAAGLFGPTLGAVVRTLRAAGYAPQSIDTVLLTHLHADHFGGLNDADGAPVFANATVHVAQADNDFWLSPQVAAGMPEAYQPHFRMARESAAGYRERGRWRTFAAGSRVLPGIRAVAASGHTPGHSAFAVESDGAQLLIWGDVMHAPAIQFADPDVAVEFDIDARQAVDTRRALLREVADSGTLVAGAHLPFPGIGQVHAEGDRGYRWQPVAIAPYPDRPRPKD